MNITDFFRRVLRAELKHKVQSWGAVDRGNRIFLRVWRDQIQTRENREWVQVDWDTAPPRAFGTKERRGHLAQLADRMPAFAVVCSRRAPGVGKIASFDQGTLLQFGALSKVSRKTYAQIVARVPVKEIVPQRRGEGALLNDVENIKQREEIDRTTQRALIDARLGQGRFRRDVLQLWSHRCAVTGSRTSEAINASHIKPWRESSDEERLDPENGLPLIANLDALFDRGLISFDSSGRLMVSRLLNATEQEIFALNSRMLRRQPSARMAAYLAFHREVRFRP